MICDDIIKILEQQFPIEFACGWDNVGLQIGSREREVNRIYIALDATDETVWEAVNVGADMLLTHHPLIFKGIKRVNAEDFIGRRIIELVKHDISYYAMHTNFDIAQMADLAAEKMQLMDTAVLQVTGDFKPAVGIGKVGHLPYEMSLSECAAYVKEAFDVECVKVFPYSSDRLVKRVAISPGSGKSVIEDAIKAHAQVLITGDIDHHEGIDAVARGMSVIDAGHYGVEKIFIPFMKQYLEQNFPDLDVIAQKPKRPFEFM